MSCLVPYDDGDIQRFSRKRKRNRRRHGDRDKIGHLVGAHTFLGTRLLRFCPADEQKDNRGNHDAANR